MKIAPRSLLLLTLTGVSLLGTPARAQATDASAAAAAERLFLEGRALIAEKRYAEACQRFAESERLDHGTGTLLNLGECYELTGRMASAWATFREAERSARREGHMGRLKFATDSVARTVQKLAYLTIVVTERPNGLVVRSNQDVVGAGAFGVAVPVDPGTYVVAATADGRKGFRQEHEVRPGERVRVEVPPLAVDPREASAGPSNASGASDASGASSRGDAQRLTGWLLGGTGVLTAGIGLGFGLVAKSKNDEALRDECTPTTCTPRGGALQDEAERAAQLSTLLVVAGGAFAIGGVVLVLTSPRGGGPSARVAIRGSQLEIGGTF